MKDARGDFQDVNVSLFPLRYTITRLKIIQKDALLKDPTFYAERLTVTLRWAPLLRGVFAGNLDGERVKAVFEEPRPGPDTPLPSLSELVPVRAVLERVQLRDSEVLYAWVRKEGWPIALGPRHRGHPGEPRLTALAWWTVRWCSPLGGGSLARERCGSRSPPIPGRSGSPSPEARGSRTSTPRSSTPTLSPKKDVALTPGSYSMKMSFRCDAGKLTGTSTPQLVGSEVQSDGDVGSALKVFFGKIVLANAGPTEGTRPSGAIAIRDDLTDPKLQLAPRLEKVIENGFSLGLQEALKRHYAGKIEASNKTEPTPLKARK